MLNIQCKHALSLTRVVANKQRWVTVVVVQFTRIFAVWSTLKLLSVLTSTAPQNKAQSSPTVRISDTLASWEIDKIPWAVVGFVPLLQKAYQCAKDSVQGGSQSHPSGCTFGVGRGQKLTTDAVPDHCSLQARLWMYCVWLGIPHQFTTTWQHPQRWTKTCTRSILQQPSLQYVHGGQRSSSGAT